MLASTFTTNQSIAPPLFNRTGHRVSTRLVRFSLNEVCDLLDIPLADGPANEDLLLFQCVSFKRGQQIYAIGQAFEMLYVINSGSAKTILVDEAGNEQILGFPMRGDLLGMDGIHPNKHTSKAVALSNCTVILLPFKELMALCKQHPMIETALYRIMSQDLLRKQAMANVLGSQRVEARIARFFLALSERFAALGYSSKEFSLSMTREEIANHLGMSLETASRTIAALNRLGFITVDGRAITLNQPQRLKTLRRLPPSKAKPAHRERSLGIQRSEAVYPSH